MEPEIIKITDPRPLWPLIVKYAKKVDMPGMTALSIIEFMVFGLNVETIAAVIDNEYVGFCTYQNPRMLYENTGIINFTYVDIRGTNITRQFYAKFAEFLRANNLKYFMSHGLTDKLGDYFKEIQSQFGLKRLKTTYLYSGMVTEGE